MSLELLMKSIKKHEKDLDVKRTGDAVEIGLKKVGESFFRVTYTFDNKGMLISSKANNSGWDSFNYTFSYDSAGRLYQRKAEVKEKRSKATGGETTITNMFSDTFTYNDDGRTMSERSESSFGDAREFGFSGECDEWHYAIDGRCVAYNHKNTHPLKEEGKEGSEVTPTNELNTTYRYYIGKNGTQKVAITDRAYENGELKSEKTRRVDLKAQAAELAQIRQSKTSKDVLIAVYTEDINIILQGVGEKSELHPISKIE